jgi:hypothetical protein
MLCVNLSTNLECNRSKTHLCASHALREELWRGDVIAEPLMGCESVRDVMALRDCCCQAGVLAQAHAALKG